MKVEVNGLGEVLRCQIDPELFGRGDRELIEDLLAAAANQAFTKGKQLYAEAMRSLAEGVDVPGLGAMLSQLSGGDPNGPGT